MAQSRLKCSDIFKTVLFAEADQKADGCGLLQVGGKSERFDWKEMKKDLCSRQQSISLGRMKDRKLGYCKYCRKQYLHIDDHVNGEQHKLSVEGTNFEALDSLISCFHSCRE